MFPRRWVSVCVSEDFDCVFIIMTFRRCSQGLNVPKFSCPFLKKLFLNLLNYFLLVNNRCGLGFFRVLHLKIKLLKLIIKLLRNLFDHTSVIATLNTTFQCLNFQHYLLCCRPQKHYHKIPFQGCN